MTRAHDHDDRKHHAHGMRPLRALVSLDEALAALMSLAKPVVRTERVSLLQVLHRVAAEDVVSPIHVPLVDRAAMDGYAVRASDTYRAGKFRPVELRCLENLYADTVAKRRVAKGACIEVATGSSVPRGADAVVMVENTEREAETVRVYSPVHPGENVSPQGEDIKKAEVVVRAGEFYTPAKVGVVAAVGRSVVDVYAKPRAAILTTGDEVVPPGAPIRPGQVYDINAHTMASIVLESGGEPVFLGRVPDRLDALKAAIRKAAKYDLVVFSGGSSVGEKDMIIDVLQAMGELKFHGVAVKPGKPTVLGVVGGKAVLGMPGYPTSCLSNCYMMLAPMLRAMARLPPKQEKVVELPLSKRIVSSMGRMEFHTVRVEDGMAVPAYKESGAITSMAHADGYIEIPANVDLVEKGERVRVVRF